MGTSYSVTVETLGTAPALAPLGRVVEGELARLEGVLSTYDPASDVSRFTAFRGTGPILVDPDLVELIEASLEVADRSGGAFDPTVGPLVEAWGFGPSDPSFPDSAAVAELLTHVGFGRLSPDRSGGTLAKSDPRTGIDLSGIAKGFAAERLARRIAALGYGSALVDVGGELRAVGSHVDGRPWRVALEGPGADAPAVLGTIDLRDEAVATSGDFRNFYEDGGLTYSHILDPRTGYPLPYRGFSVSVVHSDATWADAWATALTVVGPEEGLELAELEGLAALFAWREPGVLVTRETTAMEGRVTFVE
jgi:thiamine biosynthesis lipoprotein